MGLIQRTRNLFSSLKALSQEQVSRNAPILRSIHQYFSAGLPIISYQNVRKLIEDSYQANVDVFSVISWVAGNAARVGLVVEVLNSKGEWEPSPNHPLQKTLDRPNPYNSGQEQRELFYTFYLATGNAYEYSPRIPVGKNKGQATEMWVLPSQDTEVISGGWMQPISAYRVTTNGNANINLPEGDVLHMKTPNLIFTAGQSLYGMPPLRAGLLALERSNNNYQASSTAFKTSGMAGIISEESDGFSPALTDEQRTNEEQRIQDDYMGVFNHGKTMVTNAKVTYTRIGLSPVDLNLIEDKRATMRDFCNIFKVSSILFNDNEASTYNNVREATKAAYEEAILPIVDKYIEKLSNWLLESYGPNVRIRPDTSNIEALERDKAAIATYATLLVDKGIITRRKAAELLGIDPAEHPLIDELTVNMGTMLLSEIGYDPMKIDPQEQKELGEHYFAKRMKEIKDGKTE